jgi:LPXTG-motif cell wall-anchored protein
MNITPDRHGAQAIVRGQPSVSSVQESSMMRMIVALKTDSTMTLLLIAAGLSLIGIGALIAFARRVDPLSGRLHTRLRKR